MKRIILCLMLGIVMAPNAFAAEEVKIGFHFPKSGPYSRIGMDQWRAAKMTTDEIDASGGILGRRVQIVWRDSQSQEAVTQKNVTELIEQEGVRMIFGGVSSAVAIVSGEVC